MKEFIDFRTSALPELQKLNIGACISGAFGLYLLGYTILYIKWEVSRCSRFHHSGGR
jgi:hypothetical protein